MMSQIAFMTILRKKFTWRSVRLHIEEEELVRIRIVMSLLFD